jgi:hypothetical protein
MRGYTNDHRAHVLTVKMPPFTWNLISILLRGRDVTQ